MKTKELNKSDSGTTRLEARVSFELKQLFQRAAELQGVTLSDFLISSARAAASQTIEEHTIIRLNAAESLAFAEALLNPPQPNAALRRAARSYRSKIGAK